MIAKVFKSGNSQAVRIPKEMRLDAPEVEITRDGEKLVLSPVTKCYGMRLVEILEELSDLELPDDPPPQERPGL